MLNNKFTGAACGIISAVTYGMNPLFGLPLYARGFTTCSVLFYRFLFAMFLLGAAMLIKKESFALKKQHLLPLISGSIMLALSCLFLFLAFHHIDAGIAATILFVYPAMVGAIMLFGFRVRQSLPTLIGMILAVGGIALLSLGGGSGKFSIPGLIYVLLSALTYAVYMVQVKVTCLKELPALTLTFYAVCIGLPLFFAASGFGRNLQMIPDWFSLGCLSGLALCPSLLAFLLMAVAIRHIGPTKTAILGALEPVTALFFGITIFGESLTFQQIAGVAVILFSVILVVIGRNPSPVKKVCSGQ